MNIVNALIDMINLNILIGNTRYTLQAYIQAYISGNILYRTKPAHRGDNYYSIEKTFLGLEFLRDDLSHKICCMRDLFKSNDRSVSLLNIPKWSILTHKKFPDYVKNLVFTCLLLFKRLDSHLFGNKGKYAFIPKDIKHMLVSYVVGCLQTADKHLNLLLQYHNCPEGLKNLSQIDRVR